MGFARFVVHVLELPTLSRPLFFTVPVAVPVIPDNPLETMPDLENYSLADFGHGRGEHQAEVVLVIVLTVDTDGFFGDELGVLTQYSTLGS
jgi:hypothetical protein